MRESDELLQRKHPGYECGLKESNKTFWRNVIRNNIYSLKGPNLENYWLIVRTLTVSLWATVSSFVKRTILENGWGSYSKLKVFSARLPVHGCPFFLTSHLTLLAPLKCLLRIPYPPPLPPANTPKWPHTLLNISKIKKNSLGKTELQKR